MFREKIPSSGPCYTVRIVVLHCIEFFPETCRPIKYYNIHKGCIRLFLNKQYIFD
jgi:hypothetical protein